MAGFSKYKTARGTMWRVSWRDAAGAQRTKRGFTTKRESEEWWRRHTTAGHSPSRLTVGEAWERAQASAQWRGSTRAAMERAWRLQVAPRWAEVPLQAVTAADVEEWLVDMSKSMSRSTVVRARSVLSRTMTWAVRAGILATSPTTAARTPRTDAPQKGPRARALDAAPRSLSIPSAEAVEAIARAAEDAAPVAGRERGAIVRVLASTGLRWGEAAGLRVADVDLDTGRATISRTISSIDGTLTEGPPKSGQARVIALPRDARTVLAEMMRGKRSGDLIFQSQSGEAMRSPGRSGWWRAAVREVRAAGVEVPETLTPHDLRHAAATAFIRAGIPIPTVARQLGHSSPRVTLDIYAGVADDDLDDVADL